MENYSDLLIIGGGINGAAIAADAAGRGLSVVLCEKGDLASGTSSASTKLIHGGLRYLEFYDFNVVRKALREREVLMRKAPHLITPLEFILPYEKHLRPAWLIRLGLLIYDYLFLGNHLPRSRGINFPNTDYGQALQEGFVKGFSYYDCQTDDARLTALNAIAAKENNATILTQHEFISAMQKKHRWKVLLKNTINNKVVAYSVNALINATGPWINQVQNKINHTTFPVNLVKGSHIIVPKIFTGDFAYILQNSDTRIVFAIPYQGKFTLIGTTDINFNFETDECKISEVEINYLCEIVNRYFKKSISAQDVITSYAGVRCLQNANEKHLSNISRDYKLNLDIENNIPLLTVIGGKLTTHRVLAEEAVDRLRPFFPQMKPAWTASTPLPGGDMHKHDFKKFYQQLKQRYSWVPEKILARYARNYGTRTEILLKNATDLGVEFAAGLYEREVEYLIEHEWAKTSDDILWRRTKLGLFFSEDNTHKLQSWLNKRLSN